MQSRVGQVDAKSSGILPAFYKSNSKYKIGTPVSMKDGKSPRLIIITQLEFINVGVMYPTGLVRVRKRSLRVHRRFVS